MICNSAFIGFPANSLTDVRIMQRTNEIEESHPGFFWFAVVLYRNLILLYSTIPKRAFQEWTHENLAWNHCQCRCADKLRCRGTSDEWPWVETRGLKWIEGRAFSLWGQPGAALGCSEMLYWLCSLKCSRPSWTKPWAPKPGLTAEPAWSRSLN